MRGPKGSVRGQHLAPDIVAAEGELPVRECRLVHQCPDRTAKEIRQDSLVSVVQQVDADVVMREAQQRMSLRSTCYAYLLAQASLNQCWSPFPGVALHRRRLAQVRASASYCTSARY